jgi:hypothetical protein
MAQETAFFDKVLWIGGQKEIVSCTCFWFQIDHGRSRTPQNQSGELINRLSADTQLVGRTLTDNISDVLRSSAQAIAGFGMMAYMSPKLTGAGMHGYPYDVQTRQALWTRYYLFRASGPAENLERVGSCVDHGCDFECMGLLQSLASSRWWASWPWCTGGL